MNVITLASLPLSMAMKTGAVVSTRAWSEWRVAVGSSPSSSRAFVLVMLEMLIVVKSSLPWRPFACVSRRTKNVDGETCEVEELEEC